MQFVSFSLFEEILISEDFIFSINKLVQQLLLPWTGGKVCLEEEEPLPKPLRRAAAGGREML